MAKDEEYDYRVFEKTYLRFITEGMDGKNEKTQAAKKEELISALYEHCVLSKVTDDAKGALLEDINLAKEKNPEKYQYPNYLPPGVTNNKN